MAVKKIVLAYDGSEDSEFALNWSKSYAQQSGAEVIITSVYDCAPPLLMENSSLLLTDLDHAYHDGLEKRLKEARKKIMAEGFTVSTEVLKGNPADEIMCYAARVNADLIICGTRGLGGFSSLLLGSVAHKLVTYSPIPVLVIKRPLPKGAPGHKLPASTPSELPS